jgi:hypothetical protein
MPRFAVAESATAAKAGAARADSGRRTNRVKTVERVAARKVFEMRNTGFMCGYS